MSPFTTRLSSVFAAALLATTLAAPAPQAAPPVPATRSSQCVSKGATAHIEWGVYVANTTMPSAQGSGSWGGGFLDNINGEVGCAPTSWQAQLDTATPQGVGCTFNTPDFCQVDQIADAIHAASGQWVYCSGDTLSDLFDDAGNIISGLTQEVGNLAGIFADFAK